MFGCLGLAALVALGAVVIGVLSMWLMSIAQVELLDASDARSTYHRAALLLTEMQYESRVYLVSEGDYGDELNAFVAEINDEIEQRLQELEEFGTVYVADDPTPLQVNALRDEVLTIVNGLTALETVEQEVLTAAVFDETRINDDMTLIVNDATTRFETAYFDLNDIRWLSVLTATFAMAVFPFLGLAVFISASRLTQPLLTLTNTMITIAGYRYRPELLAKLQKKRGIVGQLAATVDEMARAVQQRRQTLEAEAAQLREDLYKARRDKLDLVEVDS
jgi:hypothetical protein